MENDIFVAELLSSWGFQELIEEFSKKRVDLEVLKCLTIHDIDKLIPEEEKFGLKIKFRQKLFEWRYQNGYITPLCDTLSMNSSIQSWITTSSLTDSTNQTLSNNSQTNPSTNAENKKENLDLESILNLSTAGKDIFRSKDDQLTNAQRKALVNIICDYWLSNEIRPNWTNCKLISRQISEIFPKESEEVYAGSKEQRGRLMSRFYSLSHKYQKSGLLKSVYKRKAETNDCLKNDSESEEGNGNLTETNEHYMWLKNNTTPESFVIEKWNLSFDLRRHHMKRNEDIFKLWPILKQRIGSSLIELDFERLYPGKNLLLFVKWETFEDKIIKLYKNDIKKGRSKDLLEKLNENVTNDVRAYIIAILLNAVLIPTVVREGRGPKNKYWKPSIVDAQNSFALLVPDIKCVPSSIDNRKTFYNDRGLGLQPQIIIVGETIDKIEKIFTYFNDILYEADNFLKALSLCFQLHQVLNIQYAKESEQVWNFIEHYFYELPISGKKTAALSVLLNNLTK